MKLIIEIDERQYNNAIIRKNSVFARDMSRMERILADGIPLPEEYKRLVDVGQCDRKLFYQQCGDADSLITVKSAFDMLMSLPTIAKTTKKNDIKEI